MITNDHKCPLFLIPLISAMPHHKHCNKSERCAISEAIACHCLPSLSCGEELCIAGSVTFSVWQSAASSGGRVISISNIRLLQQQCHADAPANLQPATECCVQYCYTQGKRTVLQTAEQSGCRNGPSCRPIIRRKPSHKGRV